MPTDSRYLYKPTVGMSNGTAREEAGGREPADRRLEQGVETRREIVETATRLFAEHGYAASLSRRCWPREVSRGALYHHFAGKEALFEAAYEAMEADLMCWDLARRRRPRP